VAFVSLQCFQPFLMVCRFLPSLLEPCCSIPCLRCAHPGTSSTSRCHNRRRRGSRLDGQQVALRCLQGGSMGRDRWLRAASRVARCDCDSALD
jgi:hypothetical protein